MYINKLTKKKKNYTDTKKDSLKTLLNYFFHSFYNKNLIKNIKSYRFHN